MSLLRQFTTAITAMGVAATACAGFWEDAARTLPGGYQSADESRSFLSGQWEGLKSIINDGRTGLVLPIYTNHPTWDYDNRHEENGMPYGGGVVRSVVDSEGNERLAYALVFADSHYSPEPFVGYSWIKRFPVSNDFHLGAGYLLGVTMRQDFRWIPVPAPLPVISAGTDNVGLYMTYIPISNVFFFFSRFSTDDRESRRYPLPSTSPFTHRTELFGGWAHVKTDSATERSYTISSDPGVLAGVRHFVTDKVAVEFNWSQSEHETCSYGKLDRKWDLTAYSVTAQYHVYFSKTLRAHAGGGIAYGRLEQQGGPKTSTDIFPVVQTGLTWAPTEHLRLMGGFNMMFPRFKSVAPNDDVRFQPFPVQMYVGAGIAF